MALPRAMLLKDPTATAAHLREVFTGLGWTSSHSLLERVLTDVSDAFAGRWEQYLANEMRYHDLGHTLQATICTADLVGGMVRSGDAPAFGQRAAELTIIAALLHDSGYLKFRGDTAGTGAKYTMVHEHRSCEFARAYLPRVGLTPEEIQDVCDAISCTGPFNRISDHAFRHDRARRSACLLVTADYLSQISAPDYPAKLDHLFSEFSEAYEHDGVPPERRPYTDATELKRRTPDFWHNFVRPMLDSEADGVHRYLSVTGQPNSYLQAIEDNLAEIHRRLHAGLA